MNPDPQMEWRVLLLREVILAASLAEVERLVAL